MSKIKILYVDDDKKILSLTKDYLEKKDPNFEVITKQSALDAYHELENNSKINIIISDYQMPNVNGLELLKKIKDKNINIPFIMFTGKGREEIAIQALNLGADYYLQKGGSPKSQFMELTNLINKLHQQIKTQKSLISSETIRSIILDVIDEHVIFYHDSSMKIKWSNKAALDSIDKNIEEIKGKHCYQLWANRNQPCDDCPVLKAMETGRLHEIIKATPDGRHWQIKGIPVKNKHNQIIGYIENTQEITEIVNLRKELAKEVKCQQIVETTPIPLFIANEKNGYIELINRKCVDFVHATNKEEILGKSALEFVIPEDHKKIMQCIRRVSKTNISEKMFCTIKCLDNHIFPAQFSISRLKTNNISGAKLVVTVEDITVRKKAEEAFQSQKMRLEKQKKELEAFASTVSHDIRGKLQIISLYNSLNNEDREENINKTIQEIVSFLENQLFLAKSGKILGDFTEIKVNELLEDIILKITRLQPNLTVKLKPLPTIIGDPIKLHQAFENILMNIVEHAEASNLLISSTETDEFYQISFKDNGVGISPEKQKEILDSLSTKDYKSIGMAIIVKIIKAHDGNLSIESSEGKGTTILVDLPKREKIRN